MTTTEDELFRKLRRISFQELCNRYVAEGNTPWESEKFIKFLNKHDWTRDEIIKEITKD